MKIKSLFIGFVTGSILTGAATLLTAPSSGKETRDRIKKNKEDIALTLLELKEKAAAVKEDASTATQAGKETLKTFIADLKILLDNWKEDIEPNKEELTKSIKEIESSIQELEAIASAPADDKKHPVE